MNYTFKNGRAREYFCAQVDQTFREVSAKNLVKLARIGEVMDRKRPPILRELSLKLCH